jgi:hypothetical protein
MLTVVLLNLSLKWGTAMKALLSAAVLLASTSQANAQYGYYAIPVAPVYQPGMMYLQTPSYSFGVAPGYTYFSNNVGTYSSYSPLPVANSIMAQQQAWRMGEQQQRSLYQPAPRHYRGW